MRLKLLLEVKIVPNEVFNARAHVTSQLDNLLLGRQLRNQVPNHCQLLTIDFVAGDGLLLAKVLSLYALIFLHLQNEMIYAFNLLLQFVFVFEAISFL